MKLRTEMTMHRKEYVPMSPTGGFPENLSALEHDATAAHALMQALQEWKNWPTYYTDEMIGLGGIAWAERRADELMREWGYADDS